MSEDSGEESLSSIVSFGGQPAAEPAKTEPAKAEVTEPVKIDAEAKASRDDQGRFAKADKAAEAKPADTKAEPVVEPKAGDKPAEKLSRADVAAIIDERKKRQELQSELDKLRQQSPAKAPSVFENEDEAIRSRVDAYLRPMRQQLYNQSMRLAQQTYGDRFAEAQEGFMEATKANPALLQEWQTSEDPGEFLYRHGMFHKKLSSVGGDLTKFEEAVTASAKAEVDALHTRLKALEAENAQLKGTQTDLANLPKSLNNRGSAAAPAGEVGDDEPITSIARFGNIKR